MRKLAIVGITTLLLVLAQTAYSAAPIGETPEQVKIFTGSGEGEDSPALEKEINRWLSRNDLTITRVMQSESAYTTHGGWSQTNFTITIFYRKSKPDTIK